jgi:tetratricopeptide (TPR) repeat protein
MSKRDRKKKKREEPGAGAPVDPRAMEGSLSDLTRHLEEQEFETIEEANAYLAKLLESGEVPPRPSRPSTQLEKAQDVIHQAFEATGKKRAQLARKALRISQDCADAYVLLAEETAKDPQEARDLYQKGVEAGERALGPEAFEEDEGYFWGAIETRPYMRARHGLALALWELGEHEEAIEHYKAMLRLNPNDNQGIRYLLVLVFLEEGSDEPLGELLEQYEDDASALWLYTRALWTFRKKGSTREANAALEEALETNPFVPLYLLGQRSLPQALPEYIGFGDESEAVAYIAEAMPAWLRTSGALEWLRVYAPEGEPDDLDLLDLDEEDVGLLAALAAEEVEAVELLREALPEYIGIEPPSAEFDAASGRLRAGFTSGEWPYEHMMPAAGWEELPEDDVELWLGGAGGLVSPRKDPGFDIEEEASIMTAQLGDWLGAVIGLVRAGVGAPASPEDLVSYINACPEVEGEISPEDASLVETAFELVLPAWREAGAIDASHRLTALGGWGLPRALAWAWEHDFDSGRPQ